MFIGVFHQPGQFADPAVSPHSAEIDEIYKMLRPAEPGRLGTDSQIFFVLPVNSPRVEKAPLHMDRAAQKHLGVVLSEPFEVLFLLDPVDEFCLEALQQFLTFLPRDTDMAYVIIQHLSPDHKSLLREILGKYTSMPVVEAVNGMRVEKNHIYMIPPRYNVEIVSDILRLREYDPGRINHPIDYFFRSLAEAYENRSVAVTVLRSSVSPW